MRSIYISIILFHLTLFSFTQQLNNLRVKQVNNINDTIKLDSLSIIPSSIQIHDENKQLIPDSLYQIDFGNSLLIPSKNLINSYKNISVTYRVFPYSFTKPYFHKDYNKLLIAQGLRKKETYYESKAFSPFEGERIQRSGSISRGISFGNNQDVIVNSNLNLQLSGKLSSDLNIVAAISDENIPIQPDGYSQQIQEFDKVYINVYNDNVNLIAGDFELEHTDGNFMRMYKKGKGGRATIISHTKSKPVKITNTISGAVSKGKYARNKVTAIEGNQGPYRLTGANNELYIIILAGTEKVYIDGRRLIRGENNDYVMDYNAAEITFTVNQPITKDKRIVVEFEYSERNYTRFMFYNNNKIETQKGSIWINVFHEQDGKNQPLQQDLSNEQKKLLSEIGDDLGSAVVENADSVGWNEDAVRYKKTVHPVINETIYVYSANPDSALYKVGFSYVGENKGNYIQEISAVNGKVFKWVEPVNDNLQGNYEPVTLLITPKKQDLITIGGMLNFNKKTSGLFEIAISNNDLNTFSTLDRADNNGYALKTGISRKLVDRDSGNILLSTSLNYELTEKNFAPIERFREVEFERDWNLTEENQAGNEHFLNFQTNFRNNKYGFAGFKSNYLNKEIGYEAFKNDLTSLFKIKKYEFNVKGSLLNSTDNYNTTSFVRHRAGLSKQLLKKLIIGIAEETEDNRWRNKLNDSLHLNSFLYNQFEAFLNYGDSADNNFNIKYTRRKDKLPYENSLINSTLGEDMNFSFQLTKIKNSTLRSSIILRRLTILDTLVSKVQEEKSIISRLEFHSQFIKRVVATTSFYEVGSGLEPIKEYSYIKVTQGDGVYTWNDYNNNEIKELNEFEIANFQDKANYIRIYTPTNKYEKILFNNFNQTLLVNPYVIWQKEKGFKRILSKFSNQFAYRVSQKSRGKNMVSNLNPFYYLVKDSLIISLNMAIRNTFSFNKQSSNFGLDYIFQNSADKMLMASGIDNKKYNLNRLQFRIKIMPGVMIYNYLDYGNKIYQSEFFKLKNYHISESSEKIEINYQPVFRTQLKLNYILSIMQNNKGEEESTTHTLGSELIKSFKNNGNLNARINFIKIDYNAGENSSVAYEMLKGLKKGNNITWYLSYRRNLISGIEISINYEGRSSKDSKVIHIGGIQLRAYF